MNKQKKTNNGQSIQHTLAIDAPVSDHYPRSKKNVHLFTLSLCIYKRKHIFSHISNNDYGSYILCVCFCRMWNIQYIKKKEWIQERFGDND